MSDQTNTEIEKLKQTIKDQETELVRLRTALNDVSKIFVQRKASFKDKMDRIAFRPLMWKFMLKVRKYFPATFDYYEAFCSARRKQRKVKVVHNNNAIHKKLPELSPLIVKWHNDQGLDLGDYVNSIQKTWKGTEIACLNDMYNEGLLDIEEWNSVTVTPNKSGKP